MLRLLALFISIGLATASTILWDGRFNDLNSSADLNNWSWSNEVGPYQYYIHGPSAVTSYVNFSPSYKNPADTGSSTGVKITLDSTSYWNGQTMRRTELIPQTTAAINAGLVYYHFSMKRSTTNPPSIYREHQINFFESHFTEMKAGWISGEAGTSDPLLRWDVGGITKWSINWDADTWHNVVYAIDFSAGTVAFYHSTGSDPLALTVAPVTASTYSNGEDWHLGVVELPVLGQSDGIEDIYFSGVYVEADGLTTNVVEAGGAVPSSSTTTTAVKTTSKQTSSVASSMAASATTTSGGASSTTSTIIAASSSASGSGAVAKWGQCGGQNYNGPTVCVSGTSCTMLNAWYYQCL